MTETADIFKRCTCCSTEWGTREEFLSDPTLKFNGYQICRPELEYGLFFFTHLKEGCCSTLSLKVLTFLDLYTGTRYHGDKALSPTCPRYCLDEGNLSRCDALCECAYVREISHIITTKKSAGTVAALSLFPESHDKQVGNQKKRQC